MLMIVGDAWTKDDVDAGRPFSGAPGSLLKNSLSQFGIDIAEARLTTLFSDYMGDIKFKLGPKADAIPGTTALMSGKYLPRRYAPDLARLHKEINDVNPTCILALGATALWATTGNSGLKNMRGTALPGLPAIGGRKVIPTYHPSAIFKEWKLRPIFLADLSKLRREMEYPDVRRPVRQVWIEPDLLDLARFEQEHILPSEFLSIDIETSGRLITCIGFAPTPHVGLVIPFIKANHALYWKTAAEEIAAWRWVKRMCALPKKAVFQNGLYDMHHLWRNYGIPCLAAERGEDTMLLHHALQPEMEKGLAFLGSIYSDEAAWKFMGRQKVGTIKKED